MTLYIRLRVKSDTLNTNKWKEEEKERTALFTVGLLSSPTARPSRDECDLLDKNVDIGSTRLTDSNESIVCHRESPSVHCRVQGFLLSDILFYFIAKRMTKGRAWKLWTFISQLLFKKKC